MIRYNLDVHASATAVAVRVLDLRIGEEDASPRIDGEPQLAGGGMPFGVRGPPSGPHPGGLAPALDGPAQISLEPDAPDGRAPFEQAPAFAGAGPVDGRVMADLAAPEASGADPLFGVQPLFGGEVAHSDHAAAGEGKELKRLSLRRPGSGLPDESLADPGVHGPAGRCGNGRRSGPRPRPGRRRSGRCPRPRGPARSVPARAGGAGRSSGART